MIHIYILYILYIIIIFIYIYIYITYIIYYIYYILHILYITYIIYYIYYILHILYITYIIYYIYYILHILYITYIIYYIYYISGCQTARVCLPHFLTTRHQPGAHLIESLLCSDGFQQGIQTAQLQVLHRLRFRTARRESRLSSRVLTSESLSKRLSSP